MQASFKKYYQYQMKSMYVMAEIYEYVDSQYNKIKDDIRYFIDYNLDKLLIKEKVCFHYLNDSTVYKEDINFVDLHLQDFSAKYERNLFSFCILNLLEPYSSYTSKSLFDLYELVSTINYHLNIFDCADKAAFDDFIDYEHYNMLGNINLLNKYADRGLYFGIDLYYELFKYLDLVSNRKEFDALFKTCKREYITPVSDDEEDSYVTEILNYISILPEFDKNREKITARFIEKNNTSYKNLPKIMVSLMNSDKDAEQAIAYHILQKRIHENDIKFAESFLFEFMANTNNYKKQRIDKIVFEVLYFFTKYFTYSKFFNICNNNQVLAKDGKKSLFSSSSNNKNIKKDKFL